MKDDKYFDALREEVRDVLKRLRADQISVDRARMENDVYRTLCKIDANNINARRFTGKPNTGVDVNLLQKGRRKSRTNSLPS